MLHVIIPAICIAVLVGGFIIFGGKFASAQRSRTMDVKIELPKIEKR